MAPGALVPSALVTVTGTTPVPGGVSTSSAVSERMIPDGAGVDPNCTLVVSSKCLPLTITHSPPAGDPEAGSSDEGSPDGHVIVTNARPGPCGRRPKRAGTVPR